MVKSNLFLADFADKIRADLFASICGKINERSALPLCLQRICGKYSFMHRNKKPFNAKIKDFRRQFCGATDVKFFLFRLCKIYA